MPLLFGQSTLLVLLLVLSLQFAWQTDTSFDTQLVLSFTVAHLKVFCSSAGLHMIGYTWGTRQSEWWAWLCPQKWTPGLTNHSRAPLSTSPFGNNPRGNGCSAIHSRRWQQSTVLSNWCISSPMFDQFLVFALVLAVYPPLFPFVCFSSRQDYTLPCTRLQRQLPFQKPQYQVLKPGM